MAQAYWKIKRIYKDQVAACNLAVSTTKYFRSGMEIRAMDLDLLCCAVGGEVAMDAQMKPKSSELKSSSRSRSRSPATAPTA